MRRLAVVTLSAAALMVVPAGVPAAASSAGPALVATSAPQAHAAVRSKKYCDAFYKQMRKTNSPAVAKLLAKLRGCVFKTTKHKKRKTTKR